jgi:hypothetical protein
MSLILSRTYPDDPIEANRENFWRVTSEGVYIGSIVYQAWQHVPVWAWTITVQDVGPDIGKSGSAPSRDEAAATKKAAATPKDDSGQFNREASNREAGATRRPVTPASPAMAAPARWAAPARLSRARAACGS